MHFSPETGVTTILDMALAGRAATLTPGTVHVWFVNLRDWHWADDDSLLDRQERERAARFVRAPDRRQFVRAHSALRRLLAAYLCTAATAFTYDVGAYGRPRVANQDALINFNISHSGDWMVLALGLDCTVGIDIEAWRDSIGDEVLIERYFSANEAALWRMESPSRRPAAFAQLWTRKEATLKALGCGFINDLSAIDTVSESTLRLSLARLRRAEELPDGVAEGVPILYDLPTPDKHAAALVCFGYATVTVCRWHGEIVQPWP